MNKFTNIAVYGGGSFGTSLAAHIARCCGHTTLFLRDLEIAKEISLKKTNSKYLGDIVLPDNLTATTDLTSITNFEIIIIAVPSSSFDDVIKLLRAFGILSSTVLLIAVKGFAKNPTELLSRRLESLLPDNPVAFIAGPNFATELAIGLLTSATIAASNIDLASKIAYTLASRCLITTAADDVVTIQVAGALKNIIAIRSGLDEAKGMGKNARAFLVTNALKELRILSEALGGMKNGLDILLEYGVIGDLMLTCYSKTSRNVKFGYEIGACKDKEKFLQGYPRLVEGVEAVKLVLDFIKKYDLVMPITSSVALELGIL
jgi:glycerol-3-phosphate dehydrogenase (NAD(P)+)